MKSHLIYLFLGAQQINSDPATPPSLKYFESTTTTPEGATYVLHLDKARRMFSPDSELQSISGTYDASTSALTEGADWAGNFWTQNSYGFGFAAASFLPNAVTSWLQTSYLWWYNNAGDGSQRYGGLNDVPAGMLCDNGSPNLCNFMQCAAGREAILRKQRFEGEHFSDHNNLHDTAALGHDFIIEGTLAGTIMQAEMLLATRNVTGAKNFFLPIMRQTSDFLETRRVQDSSALTPGAAGLFFAGAGANLLAPAFGGQGLPAGCLSNSSCGTEFFPECCQQLGFSYLTGLTITYTGVLDRLIALEEMVYPDGRNCTRGQTCLSVFQARRQNNVDSIAAVTAIMESTNTSYLIKSLSPDGEKHGVYSKPVVDCLPDQPCPPATRHGYFETSPNVDAIALNVVSKDLKKDFYDSMQSINGISPCGFTVPNFPDYDDAACTAENVGNCYVYGTWVSGGSWSTLEGRVILAHIDQRRYDLALASMSRIIYPYAELFKLDNPIAHMGCGPGMYGQGKGKEGPQLTVDIFGIPAAFVRGLLNVRYSSGFGMTIVPRLPSGVSKIRQKFPVRWGELSMFFTLVGNGGDAVTAVTIDGVDCPQCLNKNEAEEALFAWEDVQGADGGAVSVVITIGSGEGGGDRESTSTVNYSLGSEENDEWLQSEKERQLFNSTILSDNCKVNATIEDWAANATEFLTKLEANELTKTREYLHVGEFFAALNASASRCEGRLSGEISPLPQEPEKWSVDYDMSYSQEEAETYFEDVYGRLWRGLGTQIATYARENASDEQLAVLSLWWGIDVDASFKELNENQRRQELKRAIKMKEEELKLLYVEAM